ncbi:MAG: S8 family serine peptidase [Thermoplasmata archaeon]|nr:MAG: S8 family serine peptidase [Thermoplasmata archaeon]
MTTPKKVLVIFFVAILISLPFADMIRNQTEESSQPELSNLPTVISFRLQDTDDDWWETTSFDSDRNGIFDSLDKKIEQNEEDFVDVYLDYEYPPTQEDIALLEEKGLYVTTLLPTAWAVGLKDVPISLLPTLAEIEGVVMVEPKGNPKYLSDIATPSVKAKESDEYSPDTAWELGYKGFGAVIAIMDTGVDNGHPSLSGKFVAGADFTKPLPYFTSDDGTYDPDDVQGHGTTCAGIAMGTGAPDGDYMGTGPDAKLVDLRIGTILGASPGEGPQSVYDAALDAIDWAIRNHANKWTKVPEEFHGIDILSLSWGIPYEGSSDGSDLYSQGLNNLVDVGVIAVVAAGNDGPDNDGFTGMGAADKAITVAATDELDTIDRGDDIIAEYSSRGPRMDDNDGNPYDELKPDVAAPGTGITNAQFDRTGDGSGNGYEPRGSGTSYATPCVAGVVALILDANSELTPEIVKEILRFTAERRGNATFPELDPFWNKDFGYGIVDAYQAVKVAESIEDVAEIDVNLQCFIMDISNSSSKYIDISGIAWSKNGEVEGVEVRIDGGKWVKVKDMDNGTWAKWTYRIQTKDLSKGNHIIEARAISGDKYSLFHEEDVFVAQSFRDDEFDAACLPGIAIIVLVLGVAVYIILRKGPKNGPENKVSDEG